MNRVYGTVLLALGILVAGCAGPPAIAREGWTLIDVLTTSERRDFQTDVVDVRNCGVPESKSTSCAAGSSASFSVGAQAEAGAGAGVVVANLDVSVGASTAFELGFDRSSGEELSLETPPDGFVNRYWVEKEFRIISGQGRIQHKDGDIENGVYTLQTGCFLRIERRETLTCNAASTPTPTPTPPPPTNTPTSIPVEPTATPTAVPVTDTNDQPAPGASRLIDGIEFVYVPAGEFTMGSDSAEIDFAVEICNQFRDNDCQRDWFADEVPQHQVYLGGYWVMKTEVTNDKFRAFVDEGGYTTQRYWSSEGWKWRSDNSVTQPDNWTDSDFNRASYPVVGVSWYEAVAYAAWLSEKTGLTLRLPTEAEWEKAARGTDGRIYPWGDFWDGERLNYCDVKCTLHLYKGYSDKEYDDGYRHIAPVGSYINGASLYGALDMAGNAWEWTNDRYDYKYDENALTRNPQGSVDGPYSVLRGGSWTDTPVFVRSARRGWVTSGSRLTNMGFRLVTPGL